MLNLREAFRIKAEERLFRDLRRIGARDDTLVRWLGQPLTEAIPTEAFEALQDYLEFAEEELRRGKKKAPPLPWEKSPALKRPGSD